MIHMRYGPARNCCLNLRIDLHRLFIGTPENIYNEPENAFVADFIGHSNIIDGTMIKDELVEILGARWACVDKGFGNNKPVDVVIRPEYRSAGYIPDS